MKKIAVISIALIVCLTWACKKKDSDPVNAVTIEKKSELYYYVTLDFAKATHYEIGSQFATKIQQILPEYEQLLDIGLAEVLSELEQAGISFSVLLNRAKNIQPQLPSDFNDEILGMCSVFSYPTDSIGDGHLSANEFLVYQLFADVGRPTQCSASGVYGSTSSTGKSIIGRNLDWYESPNYVYNKIHSITVFKNGSKSFLNVGFLGQLGIVSALSSSGIFASILDDDSGEPYPSTEGKHSYPFDIRYCLENNTSLIDIADYLRIQPYTFSHIVFLANENTVKVLENDLNGGDRHLRSDTSLLKPGYSWGIQDAIATVNCNLLPKNCSNGYDSVDMKRWRNFKMLYTDYTDLGKISVDEIKLITGFPSTDGNAALSGAIFRSKVYPSLQSIVYDYDNYEMWIAFAPVGPMPFTPTYVKVLSEIPF